MRVVGAQVGRFANQRGETLIEVLIAIILIGAVASAYFLTASTQTRASSLNKELVQADAIARSYAELAKAEVRESCGSGGNFSVDTSDPVAFPPTFGITTSPDPMPCPSTTSPQTIDLSVDTPGGGAAHLSFAVLAP
jgi:prepilin-type N-terminal cleavage/methylation domain-containing protein